MTSKDTEHLILSSKDVIQQIVSCIMPNKRLQYFNLIKEMSQDNLQKEETKD